ncbi:GNAT family N-acetyltransferase [Pseudoalteromonas xiamenensis]|uniref:GNAT family N-acetyltransferase n=1 Tax=Pseudoalteromonas xiamenensis TaxID=882626 RepID=UPI0027E414EF|nr:GNAT family N-acetyltransferase [Pseudoalteromonas xiamenensis]WMN60122.1 GNAT family N-acetyltransferase [Pseudoalteromonas xiamenensis]
MIRDMSKTDFELFWPTFQSIIQAQETYAFDPTLSREDAYELWCVQPLKTFVYIENETVLGSYYLKANAMGPSNHVSNCGYMVCEQARGKGVAKKLCIHSQLVARQEGFKAMQFNSVVSTNETAVSLWQKLGFEIVGVLPKAYNHLRFGYVDSYVMYKWL